MSMMMPPDPSAVPNLPIAPGGGDTPPPPMDPMNQGPIPAGPGGGGMEGLLASLAGGAGGPGGPPDAGGPPEGDMTTDGTDPSQDDQMDPKEHIQQAMKHLLMALAKEPDEQASHGITKGMGALQGILAGEQKKNALIGG
jgi:hypothetical protein